MKKKTWIVAVHRAGARFFACDRRDEKPALFESINHPEGRLKESQLVSDKSGRSMSESNPGGNTFGASTSAKETEARSFAKSLAEKLEQSAYQGNYEALMLVAEPGLAGMLKSQLGKHAESKLESIVSADYAHLSDNELQERLSSILRGETQRS